MTTPYSSTRRHSAATDLALTETNTSFAGDMKDDAQQGKYIDDNEKTLSDLRRGENSSNHAKTKLFKAMTQLKSKLKPKKEKEEQKPSMPSNYYPNSAQTFEALAISRM